MKKKFKTIMALTAALAISVSGMCITSAADILPSDDGNIIDERPFFLTVEDKLMADITFGSMQFTYDLNNQSWTGFEDGENNLVLVTNKSTCPMNLEFGINVVDEKYKLPGFRLTNVNTSDIDESIIVCEPGDGSEYGYSNPKMLALNEQCGVYLTIGNTEADMTSLAGLDTEAVGNIKVKLSKYYG